MPITIKTNAMKYKKSDGTYEGFNAIAQESTAQQIASIQSAGTAQVDSVEQKGAEVLASIPSDYTELTSEVGSLKSAIVIDDFSLNGNSGTASFTPVRIDGEKVTSSTGVISQDASFSRSDYTPVFNASSLTFSFQVTNVCFYNKNKTYISGQASITTKTVPADAYYFIFSIPKASTMPVVTLTDSTPTLEKLKNDLQNNIDKNSSEFITVLTTGELDNDITPLQLISGEYVKSSDGQIYTGSSYKRTDYIKVNAGKITTEIPASYTGSLNALCFYDSSKTFISGVQSVDTREYTDIPINAVYIIISGSGTAINDCKIINKVDTVLSRSWCYGKKINWIGDSIVDGQDFDEYVTSALGLTETDYGINGSTIALKADGTDGRNALCARYTSMSNDADIIAVSCGTNDFEYAWCPIGTIEDADDGTSNTTFYGALKALCKGLITKYPKKLIFFTTPIKRGQPFADGAGGEYTQDGVTLTPFSKNKYGKTLGDYADIIKEVCGLYSIPVLDMYRESLLNPHLTAQQDMFDNVLTHPNTDGQKIMARRVAGWMTQLGYNVT